MRDAHGTARAPPGTQLPSFVVHRSTFPHALHGHYEYSINIIPELNIPKMKLEEGI
ncbi:hypothetical protein C7S16_4063 [Burkholderia thailandensis]|uniref:Uncharacterized protein n=1 Tax=Burkholderia thailandensis TaxID=57975 RepID=A0AAW9D456_BURTH|nr:hypothetical protein [Burkholderia thailandensis]MDW9256511.1 hypothetical protein [Burkholderia thailandensis]